MTYFQLNLIHTLGPGLHSSASYAEACNALVAAISNECHFTGHYSGAKLERVLSIVETATVGHRVVAIFLIWWISIEGLLPLGQWSHDILSR